MLFGGVVEVMEEVVVVITANHFRFRRKVRIRLICRCSHGYRRVPASKELTTSLPPSSSLEATARVWTTRMYVWVFETTPSTLVCTGTSWTCSPSPHYLAASPLISHSTLRSAPTSSGFGLEAVAGSMKREKKKEEVAAESGVLSIKPQVSLTGPIFVSKYGTLCFPTYIGHKILPKITNPKWSQ